jgi:hypothetical protein
VNDGINPQHGTFQSGPGRNVALHPIVALACLAAEHASSVPGLAQAPDDLTSEDAGAACDEDVHRVADIVLETRILGTR